MVDGRRRRWIAWDTDFNAGLGADIREPFGVVGCYVFQSFIAACKKNTIQGRMSYSSEPEALMMMGLPGLELTNEKGEPWDLNDLWNFLSRRKQIRRLTKGRVVTVISTRWEQWQKPPHKTSSDPADAPATPHGRDEQAQQRLGQAQQRQKQAKGKPQTSRSDTKKADALVAAISLDPYPDIDLDPDSDRFSDPDTPAPAPTAVDDAIDLHRQLAEKESQSRRGEGEKLRGLIDRLDAACVGEHRPTVRSEAVQVVAVCQHVVDVSIIESAVTEAERGRTPLTMPRGLFPIVQRHCQKRGLPVPMLSLPVAGRRVS